MKKYFSNIFALAALLMAGAAFTACSSEDNSIEQPANPVGEKTYTLTINASKGANASTRALKLETSGALTAYWENDDQLTVFNQTKKAALTGSLKAKNASGATATFSGALTGTIEAGDYLVLSYHQPTGMGDYSAQTGTLESAAARDFAKATVTVASVNAGEITIDGGSASFQTQTAMLKLTLTDGTTPLNATQLNVSAAMTVLGVPVIENLATFNPTAATYTTNGNGILYFALPDKATVAAALYASIINDYPAMASSLTASAVETALTGATLTYAATVGSDVYTATKTGYNFVASKYYAGTLTMAPAPVGTVLSSISGAYTAQNGETLTGTLANNVQISIADGATVILNNVTINGTNDSNWAGITCLGDATIILSGTNTVKGFYEEYPGIQAAAGKTLTIQGTGSLTASSNGWGAGIGGGWEIDCGNIEIQGGTITATGGEGAAGIGSGGNGASCGTITISGGTVSATGGDAAAGIGSGTKSSCGTITITSGVTHVTATKGGAANSIGAGVNGTCGTVTIEDESKVTKN